MLRLVFSLLVGALSSASGTAVEFTPGQIEFFEKEVRPVLAENCFDCHSGRSAKVGLRLDSRQGVLRGTDYHKVIDPESPSASRLLIAVKHAGSGVQKMPEKAAKLPPESIQALENWIGMGLPWPNSSEDLTAESASEDHWAFQPVTKPELPRDAGHPIDYFIRKKLAASKLDPAPQADRYTLYRRAHFDLLGLPPQYEELQQFAKDPRPREAVWIALIDRLLASPHYGERWARHWMDVARYSDTKGYEAGGRERRFVYSHTYRDWLIRAFNENLPYDRFVLYQLAADRLVKPDSPEKKHLAAMGFLTLSKNGREDEVIDDRMDTTFRGLQALTISCAKCHDHKSDPISTQEYYGIYGIFRDSVKPGEYPTIGEPRSGPEYDAYRKKLAEKQKVVDDFLEPKLAEVAIKYPKIAGQRAQLIGKLERADRRKLQNLQKVVDKFVADSGMEADKALTLTERSAPTAQRVFIRGNPGRRGDVVPRRFLSCVAGENPPEYKEGSGRLEMARTIADAKNPLTARAIVNRIWMHHFGEGIVATESDFGIEGQRPSHPELLNWLAVWFVENGWSIKKLHRLILTSETWQQASVHPKATAFAGIDPENRLLWRQNRQRLDFEQMRDGMLAIAGNLDPVLFGRSVKLLAPPFSIRRSVYAYIDRQNVLPTLRIFDFSNPQQHTGQRPRTTIPMQALFAMNSPFVQAQSRALTHLPAVAKAPDEKDRIQAIHRAVLAREAKTEELQLASSFVKEFGAEAKDLQGRQTSTEWEYGYGSVDPETGAVVFTRYPHWNGENWQMAAKYPLAGDPGAYLGARRDGSSHTGESPDHASIYRWTAPEKMAVTISGKITRSESVIGKGDGLTGMIATSGQGIVLSRSLPSLAGEAPMDIEKLRVYAGDTVDFIVGANGNTSYDSYRWAPRIRNAGRPAEAWDFSDQFSGPADFADAWESYAQALFGTNDFLFID